MLKRYNYYFSEEQIKLLEILNEVSVSEHIRRAIDAYIKEHSLKVSTSPSYDKKA
jgi:hypothetical protein